VPYFVYAIIDPRSDQIFYVGQTSFFTRRCDQHRDGTDSLSGLHVRQIKENGFVPHFVKLEACRDETAALMAEIFWIELLKSRGLKLANAQAFAGYAERGRERARRTRDFNGMRQAKLKAIASGKPARETKAWSKRDLARLKGMAGTSMSLAEMADALGRSMGAVRAQLAALKRDTQSMR